MWLHAEGGGEFIVPTGARVVVTPLRAHDAKITLCQFLEAGVAVALAVAFPGFPAAILAFDVTGMSEADVAADVFVQRDRLIIES